MPNNFGELKEIQNMLRGASCDISNFKEELLNAPFEKVQTLKEKVSEIVSLITEIGEY